MFVRELEFNRLEAVNESTHDELEISCNLLKIKIKISEDKDKGPLSLLSSRFPYKQAFPFYYPD